MAESMETTTCGGKGGGLWEEEKLSMEFVVRGLTSFPTRMGETL